MKVLIISILLSSLSFSCAKRKAPKGNKGFDIYKSQFQEEAAKRGVEITDAELSFPIAFGDPGEGNDGACVEIVKGHNHFPVSTNSMEGANRFILIDPSILERNLFYIESVVFHELAHCVLAREHIEDKSLMNTSQARNGDYPYLRDAYLDELFGVEANFDSERIVEHKSCPFDMVQEKVADDLRYEAFGRELRRTVYRGSNGPLGESSCVIANLK